MIFVLFLPLLLAIIAMSKTKNMKQSFAVFIILTVLQYVICLNFFDFGYLTLIGPIISLIVVFLLAGIFGNHVSNKRYELVFLLGLVPWFIGWGFTLYGLFFALVFAFIKISIGMMKKK